MKICVCDQNEERAAFEERVIKEYFEEKGSEYSLHFFECATDLLVSEEAETTDLFIIDINSCNMQGINVIRELKERFPNRACIVTSSDYENLDEAMDLRVLRYIVDWSKKECFYSALDKAVSVINESVITVKSRSGKIYRLHKNDIVCTETKQRRMYITTSAGVIETNHNINEIKDFLNTPDFIRTHYSYVANKNYFSHTEGKDMMMRVNYHYVRVPIASKRYSEVKNQLIKI